jgi:two-component system alkaline phosphatase synthesis response regulator PhoP
MTREGAAARILVVEDEESLADTVRYNLEREGYSVAVASDGREALDRFRSESPSLVILDLMLPEMSGLDVCRQIRQMSDVPIIMVTAKDLEADKVSGLELGADDYVTKPFSPKELVARVGALLRRADRSLKPATQLQYGPISINLERHEVRVASDDVRLTAKEFLLLQYLLEHRGRVLSRDLLLTDVWGYQYTGGTRTVDVHVRRLREKLPVLVHAVETIKQFGYKLKTDGPDGDAS